MSPLPGATPPQRAAHGEATTDLAARAARLHFDFGLTHQEAADVLGLSRVKVTRLIKHAHEAGLIRIVIASDASPFAELESALTARYGLVEVIVVPPPGGGSGDLRAMLAQGTAAYLARVIRDEMVVAVGMSRTIGEAARRVATMAPTRRSTTFVSLVGAVRDDGGTGGSAYEAAAWLAQSFGGTVEHLHAPVIVRSAAVAQELMQDPSIARTLKLAASADVLFAGVGGRVDRIDLYGLGYLEKREWQELAAAGMVGDMCARFFDHDGQSVEHEVSGRVIGLSFEQLTRIPARVVAAGGASKLEALRATLRGGLATVLVTDATTARDLLADR
jgi:lsr operon transcriptional repressor